MKQYLTDVNEMREWLKPLYWPGYIENLDDNGVIQIYGLLKGGLK